ncbi:hypothetical protein IJ182_06130 [bacterium]|nr:hypothetical protein [bacterium]
MKIQAINNLKCANICNKTNFGQKKYELKSDEVIISAKNSEQKRSKKVGSFLSGLLPFQKADDGISQSLLYIKKGKIGKNIKLADGFMDTGISGEITQDGEVKSNREIIVVDRESDEKLNKIIKNIKKNTKTMTDKEKAGYICAYLHNYKNPDDNSSNVLTPNKKILVGDTLGMFCTAGRHNSIAFKVIADEIGLKCDLVKGTVMGSKHAWNVVYLKNNPPLIYDSTLQIVERKNESRVYREYK